ncbi:MAG: type II secretion system protein [Pseudomonadota bacterium]
MNKQKMTTIRGAAQAGFTLIELIVVIVILGILAATAIPKFSDLGGDARLAKMQAAQAAIKSASAIYHAQWLARGSDATVLALNGVTGNATGYPVAAAGGMDVAAGLTGGDYVYTAGVVTPDSTTARASCSVTYVEASGTTTIAATASNCQ